MTYWERIPDRWAELAEGLCGKGRVVFLLGASDTGKTTLCRYLLAEALRKGLRCAYLDADIGQSVVGPPTTLGLSVLEEERSLHALIPHCLYFSGAISPVQALLASVVGARRLLDRARIWGAEFTVVDTTGLVSGDAGFQLKYYKIDVLAPTDVLAIQREGELEPILKAIKGRGELKVHLLSPLPGVRSRDFLQRQSYRASKIQEYLSKATEWTLPLGERPLIHPCLPFLGGDGLERLKGRVVGLIGKDGFALGIGVLLGLEKGELRILTPVEDLDGVEFIQVGAYNVLQDAQRLGSPQGGLGR